MHDLYENYTEEQDLLINLIDDYSFIALDREKFICFGLLNKHEVNIKNHDIITKSIELIQNKKIISTEIPSQTYYATFFRLKDTNYNSINTFVDLCYKYIRQFGNDITEIVDVFDELVRLFNQNHPIKNIEIQGLYAELYLIYYFNNLGINIGKYWQNKDKLIFDFSISQSKKIEVKSTLRNQRIHHFKQEQLNDSFDVLITSLLLKYDNKGLSLQDLYDKVNSDYIPFNMELKIKNILRNATTIQLESSTYNELLINQNLAFYKNQNLPKIDTQDQSISNLEFDVDLSNLKKMTNDEIITWFNY